MNNANVLGWNAVTITKVNCSSKTDTNLTPPTSFEEQLHTWLLLDNCSTDNIFCNSKYLKNIRQVDSTLRLTSNGGGLKTNLVGDFPRFGTVWYDPKGITNTILQDKVEAMGYDVTYDKENKQYIVTGKKGHVNFNKATIGLWYYPLEAIENKSITLVETIKDWTAGYSERQIK